MPKKPTRDQLARFLPTQELIRAFEQLFDMADGDSGDITALQLAVNTLAARVLEAEEAIAAGEIDALAESAQSHAVAAAVGELAKAVDGLAMAPPIVPASPASASPPGAANSVIVSCDFGASFTDKAQTVVTGQAWVTALSSLSATVMTPSGTDPDEMYLLDITPVVSDPVIGDGFTVTLYSMSEARGAYDVMVTGV